MSTSRRKLTRDEVERAFCSDSNTGVPPIIGPKQLAQLAGLSIKTIYEWISKGRLDGTFRKRGKHVLIWRDRAIECIFNGPDWSTQ